MKNKIEIIQPDDWHVHFREDEMLKTITHYSSRINKRCIAMPNTETPITNSTKAEYYRSEIIKNSKSDNFEILIPCFLTENLDLDDFKQGLEKNIFIGAKLYPTNATTNSSLGISKIENIYPALEILEKENKMLLIHGEKIRKDIDIFDREKYFIDGELHRIRNKFKELRIVLEHISTSHGIDFVKSNKNMGGTITPHHMLLTKKDVFINNSINLHHFCMPVVKNESDLIALRKAACNENTKFFLGTDSAPHHVNNKIVNISSKPGIFSAVCSIELYASIFEEEDALKNLEAFSSINGPNFYNLPINNHHIILSREEWIVPEYTEKEKIKVKNFHGGTKLHWKVKNLKV